MTSRKFLPPSPEFKLPVSVCQLEVLGLVSSTEAYSFSPAGEEMAASRLPDPPITCTARVARRGNARQTQPAPLLSSRYQVNSHVLQQVAVLSMFERISWGQRGMGQSKYSCESGS